MSRIYEAEDYKLFIKQMIELNRHVRGYQTRLAQAADCKPSYFSGVLNSVLHLTLEHAVGLCVFWKLDGEETDYFLDLVILQKTENVLLRAQIKRRLLEKKMRIVQIPFVAQTSIVR